jgi:DNA-binding PadR family transcriptional regulator
MRHPRPEEGGAAVSPVFRHGGLRLYLLKLLDEEPRHGYDVIRLLQDRFMGVYSPSPGTIYPRLARLEEEGLVTHEVIDGKKVYKITDAGRAELNRRGDDLADLEDELAASVRDIAREISRDVRETVRYMRDELTWAVRESGRGGRPAGPPRPGRQEPADGEGSGGVWSDAAADGGNGNGDGDGVSAGEPSAEGARSGPAGDSQHRHPPGDWRQWAGWAERQDWREWADWAKRQDWGDWTARQEWKERAKGEQQEWKERAKAERQEWKDRARADRDEWKQQARAAGAESGERAGAGSEQESGSQQEGAGEPRGRRPEGDLGYDLERFAAIFAREIRGVARNAEMLSEDAVGNLGRILNETLNRIKTEVFRAPAGQPQAADAPSADAPAGDTPAGDARSGDAGAEEPAAGQDNDREADGDADEADGDAGRGAADGDHG